MERPLSTLPHYLPPLLRPLRQPGGANMERLTRRVDRLEQHTQQIKSDLAVLTERSQNFATKTDVEGLRTDQFRLRCEMLEGFAQTSAQFARSDERFARVSDWTVQADSNFAAIDRQFERINKQFERVDEKFARVDEKFDRLNDRITWTLMVPAVLAVLGWLAREFWIR